MTHSQSETKTDVESLAGRLRQIAKGRDAIDVARIHVVGLDEVERAYGKRWPIQRERIQDAAETFLRRRINASDVLIRGENGFLVVLDGATPDRAAAAAQVTQDLNQFFLGQPDQSPAPQFDSSVAAMSVADLASACEADGSDGILAPSAEKPQRLSDLEWRFEPVWDVRRETLSTWYVVPHLKSTGERLGGYHFENVALRSSRFARVDEAGLKVADETLVKLLAAGRPTLVGASVHIKTLVNHDARTRIFSLIDRLDPDLHRFRVIKVAGVAPGFPRMYVEEIIGALKSRLPNIVIGVSWDEPDLAGLLRSDPAGLGLSVPRSAIASGSIIALPLLVTRLSQATSTAHAARTRVQVDGAITKFLALKLAKAGIDNIASQKIWPARPMPEGMLKWPAGHLAAA